MKSISQFWNSGLIGKIVLGCGGLVGLLCICGFCATVFATVGSSTRTPTASQPVAQSRPTSSPALTPTLGSAAAAQSAPTTANTQEPATQAKPTAVPKPSETMTANEKLSQLANNGLEKNTLSGFIELRSVAITSAKAIIDYGTTDLVFDQESAVTPFMHNLENTVPQVFAGFPSVNALELHQNTKLQDAYGNSTEGVIIRVVITRATSAKINWTTFRPKNLPIVLTGNGDSFFVHDAVSDGWATYQNKY
jgi:hypothetical protein